jgi:uncharacterized protein (TIGR04222 family)
MQLFSSWTGSDFLLFYIMLLLVATLAAWWMPAHLRGEGGRGESADAEDIAFLAGGRASHTDSVIADLFARGGIIETGNGRFSVIEQGLPASPSGRALLATRTPFSREEAHSVLAIHAARIAARLRREGLMLGPEQANRLRWLSVAPFMTLALIGLYRQRSGSALGEPTGFLIVLLVITAVLTLIRFIKFDQRTAAGIEAVRDRRESASRLRRAPQANEAALAVALFGTGVLAGTPWEHVHALRRKGTSDGSGDSNGGDGGGDGGGGCGGCGG